VHNCSYKWVIGTSHAWSVFLVPVSGAVPGPTGCVLVCWKALGCETATDVQCVNAGPRTRPDGAAAQFQDIDRVSRLPTTVGLVGQGFPLSQGSRRAVSPRFGRERSTPSPLRYQGSHRHLRCRYASAGKGTLSVPVYVWRS
jgi:hypothetical protein